MVQTEHKENAAEHQHGGPDHSAHKLWNQILHLRDIVRHACDEWTGSKLIHLWEGKGHDPAKGILSYFISHILSGHMNKHIVEGTAQTAKKNETDHLKSQCPDEMQIADTAIGSAKYTFIYDAAHDFRLKQIPFHNKISRYLNNIS